MPSNHTIKTQKSYNPQTLYVLLDQAPLEIAKIHDEFVLLSADKHFQYLSHRHDRDPALYRPDILHHCLLNLIDSPINKAGHLKIYIRTHNNVLIDIHPQCRLPRSYSRFAGLMVQLLFKFKIRASDRDLTLMKTIRNDFMAELPVQCPVIAFEKGDSPIKLWQTIPTLTKRISDPVCFVIGAFATGDLKVQGDIPVTKYLSLSNYGLSAAICCAKVCTAYEELWGIL